ncbi:catalase [Shewanella profunda]|uniref:putative metalloprotease CJM1_0395 family protein n=1 Tax=Shewanella profunda TaxID=254793 RepID=UPI00200D08E0|nr:putative metalloprotease CJM1_0395 family protein [Shewanella profunda]MCL1088880.1 catalase [Shewanella profunda]
MSAVALSSKVGASPTSFLEHDKSFGQSRTYQGTNGQSSESVKLSSSKIEASGVFEPTFSSALAHGGSTVTTTAANIPLSSKPFSGTTNDASVTVNQTLDTDIVSSQSFAVLHADATSFSLLTGPRSISGVREGQIATVSTNDFSSFATQSGLSSTAPSFDPSLTPFSLGGSTTRALPLEPTNGQNSSPEITGSHVYSGMEGMPFNSKVPNASDAEYSSRQVTTSATTTNTVTTDNADSTGFYTQVEQIDGQAQNVSKQSIPEVQFIEIFGKPAVSETAPNPDNDAKTEENRQQALAAIFTNGSDKEQTKQTEASKQQADEQAAKQIQDQTQEVQKEIAEQQRAQVAELKARDAEVKAHEHAHATVGGQHAQTPSFKYEKGVDGQRYATDGEVQIDVSVVAGDPLATINKMKQVYAAAMAPVDPSSADIRVAAEALKKMNEAKALLAEERQKQIIDVETTQTLIEAEPQIEELPPIKPHTVSVKGDVDASGNIVQPQDSTTPISELIDRIKQGIEQKQSTQTQAPSSTVTSVDEQAQSATKETTTEPIELPTATLAADSATADIASMMSNSAPMNRFDSSNIKVESVATRYYAAVAQLNQPFSSV